LKDKVERSEEAKARLKGVLDAFGLMPDEDVADGERSWASVLIEIGDRGASRELLEELKARYEFQGFKASLVAAEMTRVGPSKLYESYEEAAYLDRLVLVLIGLMRGANIAKMEKGMREDAK
ncbi:unnamed protein product, partial [Ixodes hexagonus]